MLQVYKVEDLLTKLEQGCLNDSAEKFFATQCNSKEAVCLLLASQFAGGINCKSSNSSRMAIIDLKLRPSTGNNLTI